MGHNLWASFTFNGLWDRQQPMAEQQTKTARAWYGVRPAFLIAGAVALMGFGVVFGVTLDLATRPAKQAAAVPQAAPKPSRQYVPANKIQLEPEAEPQQASILSTNPPSEIKPLAQQALTMNAVPSPRAGDIVLAIVIDDMGLDRPRAVKMISLDGPLTLSLMTYADGLPSLVTQARERGHEVMAHLPMEPLDPKENPGPGALRVSMDEATIRKTLAADLDGWSGYVGINNHMGSKFTKDRVRMNIVMEELKARGLLWLDSKTIGDTVGPQAAKAAGVPYVERDVFLDNTETVEAVTAQLEALVTTAKAHGSAIGIGHPHDATFTALRAWLPHLAGRGITLVPVTETLKRRTLKAPG